MDQPTYTPVQRIVESSGTLFFSFQDLDSTKPAGSVKIRVETIAHYLKQYSAEIIARKKAASRPGPVIAWHWPRAPHNRSALLLHGWSSEASLVFFFFSNRFGCLGSIVISIALSALVIVLMRSCSFGTGF